MKTLQCFHPGFSTAAPCFIQTRIRREHVQENVSGSDQSRLLRLHSEDQN